MVNSSCLDVSLLMVLHAGWYIPLFLIQDALCPLLSGILVGSFVAGKVQDIKFSDQGLESWKPLLGTNVEGFLKLSSANWYTMLYMLHEGE